MSNDQQLPSPPSISLQSTKKYANGPTKNYESWYLDSSTADVHFSFDLVGNHSSSTRLGAHKTLLAINSDVFKAMFYGELKEKGDIRMIDASNVAFEKFLQFFYLNEVELSFEYIADVMNLGHKYMVTNCIDIGIQFLKDCHTADNILFVLSLAMLYGHSELVKLCEQFIILNTIAVLNSAGFLECNRPILTYILNKNLFICSEIELFESCMAWVKAKSYGVLSKETVDEHLGKLFYEFRFGSMTIQKFCNLAKKYDTVLSNDFKAITELIVLPQLQHDKFRTCPRKINWNEAGAIAVHGDLYRIGDLIKATCFEWIKFTANKPLLLTGFMCSRLESLTTITDADDEDDDSHSSNRVNISSSISVQVKIREALQVDFRNNRDLLKTSAKLQHDSTHVSLPRSILIKPGLVYQISIRYPYEYTYYSKEIQKTVQLPSDTTIEFHGNRTTNQGEKIVGLFSAIEFIQI